ncbi:MAG: hypothetical protein ACI4KR_12615, partial [Ruminiclostridium sp.]
ISAEDGRKFANGSPPHKLFTLEDDAMEHIENAVLLFRDGSSGERFADTITRLVLITFRTSFRTTGQTRLLFSIKL